MGGFGNRPIGRRLLTACLVAAGFGASAVFFTGLAAAPVAASAGLSPTSPAKARGDTPVERAVELANRGNVDRAIEVLRDHLKKDAKDVRARVVLGQILDFDGRPDEAVALWEEGLEAAPDFTLLMVTGQLRFRQGTEGPTVSRRRGMMAVSPSKDKEGEERVKQSHLAQAATAFERARKLRPEDPEAARALASVYAEQKKFDAAAEVWKALIELEPKDGGHRLGLALAIQQAGRADEAAQHMKKAIELNPRLADAYEALAEYQQKKGLADEAEQTRKRGEFYKRLPAFCTLTYSEANQKTLDSLEQEAAVRKLADDPSESAAEFLAVLCWSHPHNQLEAQAFEALEARGEKTTPLLRALFDGAQSTCTIRSTAHILARRKVGGLFDRLTPMLPGDLRGFGMDMDIAGSLDDLGDPRAVGPLVQVLNPGAADAPQDNGPLADRHSARGRAALALGAFDTPEARKALDAGTRDPQVAAYCLAALYRLTKDPSRLAALEKSVGPEEDYASYVLGNYLLQKVGTEPAKALSRKWEERREARSREKKKEAGAD